MPQAGFCTSSVLYIPMPTPPSLKSKTFILFASPPLEGVNTSSKVPGSVTTKSVALYWSRSKRQLITSFFQTRQQKLEYNMSKWPENLPEKSRILQNFQKKNKKHLHINMITDAAFHLKFVISLKLKLFKFFNRKSQILQYYPHKTFFAN